MSPSEVTSTEPPLPFGAKASASTTPLRFTAAFTTWVATLAEIRTWPERACRVPVLLTPTRVAVGSDLLHRLGRDDEVDEAVTPRDRG